MRKYWDNAAEDAGGEARAQQAITPVPACVMIGGVAIAPATVLAPMAGVTDTVFRRFIRNLGGCGLIMTEFTSADGILRAKDKKAKRYLHFYEDEHPISAQLFGSDPKVMAEAAHLVEDLGFDLVDLNLGCPAKKVVKCNGGSGLLRDLPAIRNIFEVVRAAVKIPFTVKFRAGWNDEEIVCVELAKMAEDCGLCAVALHARTREQGYSGQACWDWIGAVKQAVKIPVIGNGDIRTPEDACAMVAQTGCDAVMIGRTAPSNPWIFRQVAQYCTHGRVGAGLRPGQVERTSTGLEARSWTAGVGAIREGHDFSLQPALSERSEPKGAAIAANSRVALAAEGGLHADGSVPSGAKAPESFEALSGTTKVVPSRTLSISEVSPQAAKAYDEPSETDRYQMIRTYFQMLIEEEMPGAEGKMKQFASWFTHGVPGGAALRKAIYESKSAPEILGRVEEFFECTLQLASTTNP